MKITFKPLWKQLIDKGMMNKDLYAVISPTIVAKMGRDENITTEMILRVCKLLDCDISDVLQLEKIDGGKDNAEYGR